MDDPTVKWSKERFDECVTKIRPFLRQQCGYAVKKEVKFIPISGLSGANVKEQVTRETSGSAQLRDMTVYPFMYCTRVLGTHYLGLVWDYFCSNERVKPLGCHPVLQRQKDRGKKKRAVTGHLTRPRPAGRVRIFFELPVESSRVGSRGGRHLIRRSWEEP